MHREQIQTLLELSTTFEQADEILKKYTNYQTDEERIAYLQGMFDCEIFHSNTKDIHTDYVALLTSIVNAKWI